MAVDFETVGAAALAMATILLPEWLGGKREGHEWLGERKSNGGPGDSWKVNLNTGAWGAFAGDERGGDLISLYAALHHIEQLAALNQVAGIVGVTDRSVAVLPSTKPDTIVEPIPDNAPPIPDHFKHGTPSALYRYGTQFLVARYDLPDGKQFAPLTWRASKWQFKAHPGPRQLYGVEILSTDATSTVIIVEGEKCADLGRQSMRRNIILTWSGGAQAVKKTDWTPLTGRDVIIWPDADDPGRRAAATITQILLPFAKRVRVINPNGAAPGWDVADAISEGWNAAKIADWAEQHLTDVAIPVDYEANIPEPAPPTVIDADPADDSAPVRWDSIGLETNQGGLPYPTLANASRILQLHPRLVGKIWYDTFQRKIWHNLRGVQTEWQDSDSADLTVFIQQTMKLSKFTLSLVTEAVGHAARRNAKNSLTNWLSSLEWDQEPRLDTWLSDTLGVDIDPYSVAVANNWPISMVARAFKPGCQVDTMPVLEGKMGRGKSSFLHILGGEWYDSITTAIGEKDFIQEIQGLWLVEIPDMTGFGRREHSHILATITIRNDRYRASYGRYVENHARGCVFSATSETDDYLSDIRGRRRFWPLRCTSIDLDTLHAQRDQIFAEAVARYRAGSPWYEMPESTDDEQLARASEDPWTTKVLAQANYLWDQSNGRTVLITSLYLLTEAIGLETKDMNQVDKNRVARIMRDSGWIQSRSHSQRHWLKTRYANP